MKKYNIINIEDSSYDSLLMKMELEESGLKLGEFVRIQTAEELKQTLLIAHWDIVICDYYLPFFDAFEAIKIIRANNPGLPLILFSGQANEDTVQKVLQAGASAIINKDHRQLLKKTIEQVVEGQVDINAFSQTDGWNFDDLDLKTDSAVLGAWDWDIVHDNLRWNEQMFVIYGVDKQLFKQDYHSWLEMVHPDDRSLTERTLQYSLRNKKVFSTEFRVIKPDGEVQHIRACGLAQWNSAGIPLRMVGTNENITQIRKVENELYLNTLILNEDPSGIMVTDTEGKILKVNQNFCKTSGYSEEELLGKQPSLLNSGKHDKKFFHTMWEVISTQGSWQGTIWDKSKDGKLYQQLLTITAIKNQYNHIIFYLASFVDLSHVEKSAKKQLLDFDLLTGLPSRYALKTKLNLLMTETEAKPHAVALIYIDLDRFQAINDALGCSVGDKVLKIIGQRITEELRSSDMASRLGGDEFVVLLNNLDMTTEHVAEVVQTISEKIKETISKPIIINNESLNISCSMGIIIYPGGCLTPDNMLSFAKSALHQAKETRDTIHFFSPAMKASLEYKINVEHVLHKAIANKELSLYYQAQVRNKHIVSAEALLRWHSESLGMVSPADFIPLAEDAGLIIPIGQWVLEEACRHIKKWEEKGLFDQKFSSVAINVSTLQFRRKGYADKVIRTIHNAKINPQHLKLELTESVLIDNDRQDLETFKKLKDLGLKFAIDDFGTGYCSFNYLYKLPLDLIKIDQSFVNNICENPKELGIVQPIVAMAKTLEIDIIAEGVESNQQADLLEQAGCNFYQGYLYSRPVPVLEFSKLLEQWNFKKESK